jgi:hypothetical protein
MPERATVTNWSEKSAEVVVAIDRAAEAGIESEGPNEEECSRSCRCYRHCVRCPLQRGGRG